MDHLTEMNQASSIAVNTMLMIGGATAEVAQKIQEQNSRLEELNAGEPGPGVIKQAQRIAISSSSALDAYADQVEEALPEFET